MKWTAFNWMMSSSALSIDELLTSGMGKRFEPRPGMVMKEWLVPADETCGLDSARQRSLRFREAWRALG
jgi:hypothetical protein